MSMNENPRLAIGGNSGDAPDFARLESDRLRRDYAETFRVVEELLADYEKIPEVLQNPEDKSACVSLIKRMRDTTKALTGYHELEKMPHFRRGQAVDQTFFGEHDKLAKRDKKQNPGAADRLNDRLTDYDVRELAMIQAKRRQEALDARKEADQVLAEAEEAEREAAVARQNVIDAEAAAARARKPENVAAHQETARVAQQEVVKATAKAAALAGDVAVSERRAEDTHISTLARPADVMRERHDDGSMSTMGTEKFATILDRQTLDLEKLRGHFTQAALQAALTQLAISYGYSNDPSVQIAGAKFGKRPKSKVL